MKMMFNKSPNEFISQNFKDFQKELIHNQGIKEDLCCY